MKNQTNNHIGFSYYEQYLLTFLHENHPHKVDIKFIIERAEQAAETFELSRLEGNTPDAAQEEAMATLTKGLHFSPYNTIVEILWNEFEAEVDPAEAEQLARSLITDAEPILAKYQIDDDFASTPQFEELYTELTGVITLKFEKYGVQ